MWFTQDVFAEAEEQNVLDKYDSNDEMEIDGGAKKIQKSKELTNDKQQGETKDLTRRKTNSGLQVSASKTDDDFEIVPAPATDSSDSSSDESDDDVDTKAEILATAKMTLKKRPREEMIDDAYNRYMKANSISDQTEISEGSKRKMIEQLYRKASSTKTRKGICSGKEGSSS
ncbi:hypothetical protein R3W88_029409 [Solanum pinnatisectum]|uniref:Ribosomal RNA methyltransferase SPB1-like C-terminal domain-containing protein n=1 Tax=Solanum pinnatisectum TaxID=50273 RepID=A0AAV9K777_9SOLN|nr:hypothetical protein R3W88_029409 [Solanum pinnatisectum]